MYDIEYKSGKKTEKPFITRYYVYFGREKFDGRMDLYLPS